jgi:DNA repair protein RecO (recombination protein O)
MDWQDEGIVISVRPHGETSAIVEAFCAVHGRHSGVVRGGASRKKAAFLQPGAQVALVWRARLEDHLGAYTVEPVRARAGLMEDRAGLAGLNAVCSLLHLALPEREDYGALYAETLALLDKIEAADLSWEADYPRWEIALLQALGFALDLSSCAVTGAREGAGDWASRLLRLPHFLRPGGNAGEPLDAQDMGDALRLTGHFLTSGLEPILNGRPLPEARARLFEVLTRAP